MIGRLENSLLRSSTCLQPTSNRIARNAINNTNIQSHLWSITPTIMMGNMDQQRTIMTFCNTMTWKAVNNLASWQPQREAQRTLATRVWHGTDADSTEGIDEWLAEFKKTDIPLGKSAANGIVLPSIPCVTHIG
jgi:hypothetical protein